MEAGKNEAEREKEREGEKVADVVECRMVD